VYCVIVELYHNGVKLVSYSFPPYHLSLPPLPSCFSRATRSGA